MRPAGQEGGAAVPRQTPSDKDVDARLATLASWQTAERDEARVARVLYETRTCDEVYAIDKATFFDELFHYCQEINLWPLLESLDPGNRKKPLYPFIQFVLFTIMRCVGGVQSMLANLPPNGFDGSDN